MKKIVSLIIVIMMITCSFCEIWAGALEEAATEQKTFDETSYRWEIETTVKEYKVTFVDEERGTNVVKYVKEGECVEPEVVSSEKIYFEKNRYKYFSEWAVVEGDKFYEFDFKEPITSDLILYAEYAFGPQPTECMPHSYLIKFDSQGGSKVEADSASGEEDFLIKKPKAPTRKGYKFLGWYTKPEGGTKWDFKNDYAEYHMTLYAHWQHIEISNVDTNAQLTSPETGYNLQIIFAILILGMSLFGISFAKFKNE